MTKHPYSTTHYHCGCHIVEDREGFTDMVESIYCLDVLPLSYREVTVAEGKCIYLPILKIRRQQAARLA